MKIYNDICGGQGLAPANTGAAEQCLESVSVIAFLAKDDFAFATVNDFKDKTKWDEAITARNVVPMYEMYELTNNNTDATYYESRNFRKRTQKAIKITTYEHYLGFCSHAALKNYENSDYSRIFFATEDGDLIGVYHSDGVKVRGQKMKQFDVGIRVDATVDKPPYTMIQITFQDHEELEQYAVLATPLFDPIEDLDGIYNVNIYQSGTASATLITFTATLGCDNDTDAALAPLIKLYSGVDGSEQTASIASVGNGTFTATGTGLVSGWLGTDGVQTLGEKQVEGTGIVTVS